MFKPGANCRAALISIVIALSSSAFQSAHSQSACVANVRVTNQRNTAIRVLSLSYTIDGSADVHKQALENKTVAANATVNWPDQVLGAADQGVLVNATAVEYNPMSTEGHISAATPRLSPWFKNSIRCSSGYDYIHYIDG